ncbi:MAG: UvrD-helicase domain-containing protein [Defluviitaleaceae bacterium]|nr:UvrD-helicase domain-containing protein [Defluviitaleaceae bacterium]
MDNFSNSLDLNSLNPAQQEAVLHTKGPLLIFAGAGSGKTRVLTYRMAHLIESGVEAHHILAITFTNKAAKEMRERVLAISTKATNCWVATFHSTCIRILRRQLDTVGGSYNSRFSIFDMGDADRLIKDCIQELNLSDKDYPVRYVANIISTQKNELITPQAFANEFAGDFRMSNVAEVYHLYQKKLVNNNALDFDDIIFRTVEIFENRPEILEKYQNRFQYIMVDEYQDTNNAQYRLILLLAGRKQNLCVVGDDDQSIYAWRGANIQNILNFERDFSKAHIVKLEQNYRSTQTILDAANEVIKYNYNRSDKSLWTDKGSGEKIKIFKASSESDEADFIASTIKESLDNGAKYSDFGVLYRNNAQSRAIEDRFVMAGLPYRLYGGVRFYERMEIRDVLAYLKAINNPFDDLSWGRIINVPKRGIGNKTLERVIEYGTQMNLSLSVALEDAKDIPGISAKTATSLTKFYNLMEGFSNFALNNSVTVLLQKILDDTGYLLSLDDDTPEADNRIANVQELVAKAYEFEASKAEDQDRSLSAFLEEVALVADIDNYDEGSETVSLMTLHSAKGLEFSRVFIVGFEENIFPSYRVVTGGDIKELEEERRLCYVGITRAKQMLYLTWSVRRMQYGREVNNSVSRFLKEIPRENYENVNTTGTAIRKAHTPISPRQKPVEKRINPYRQEIPIPKNKPLEFAIGDRVRQMKYGSGVITAINPGGADYEVTVLFDKVGEKKIMANLSRLMPDNK